VITVIVCVLWVAVPQVQELITSLIVLNTLWLTQMATSSSVHTLQVVPPVHHRSHSNRLRSVASFRGLEGAGMIVADRST
jgi:hypothetical protein